MERFLIKLLACSSDYQGANIFPVVKDKTMEQEDSHFNAIYLMLLTFVFSLNPF